MSGSGKPNDEPGNTSPDRWDSSSSSQYRNLSTTHEDPLNRQIMTMGYAVGVVVLSIGIVILTITMAVLCFLYPDKANSFLVLLASPIAILVVTNAFRLGGIIKQGKQNKQDIKELQDAQPKQD